MNTTAFPAFNQSLLDPGHDVPLGWIHKGLVLPIQLKTVIAVWPWMWTEVEPPLVLLQDICRTQEKLPPVFGDFILLFEISAQHGLGRSRTVSYGPGRSRTVSYGLIRSYTVSYGFIRCHTVSYGFIRFYTVSYGLIRSHTVSYGLIRSQAEKTRFRHVFLLFWMRGISAQVGISGGGCFFEAQIARLSFF